MKVVTEFSFVCKSNFAPPMINAAIFDTPYGEMKIDRDKTYYSFEDGVLSMDWSSPYLLNVFYVGLEDESHFISAELFEHSVLRGFEIEDDAFLECEDYYCDCIEWNCFTEETPQNDPHRPYIAPDWNDYDCVMGQDHEWYLYSNKHNSWYPTGFSWNRVSEDEMMAATNAMGVGGDWLPHSDLFEDI